MSGARGRWRALGALVPAVAALAAAAGASVAPASDAPASHAEPRCYGAASRDTVAPCHNSELRTRVSPTPIDAVLTGSGRCQQLEEIDVVHPCRFGDASSDPLGDIALIGDSHAGHWRPAVDHVARERKWRGTSITRSSCAFSAAPPRLPPVAKRQCERWNRGVLAWLTDHPEVHTIFLSAHAEIGLKVPRGSSRLEARTRGYVKAMRQLPSSVSRVIVLRDTPLRRLRTLDCIEAAMDDGKPAGESCAVPRARVLKPDADAIAARKLGGPRFAVADLSQYVCSVRLCLPVVGGALVNRDGDHMTSAFSTSLGPYLLRRVGQLEPFATE